MYLLKSRDEVCDVFETFHKMIDTMFNTKIQTLRSHNGENICHISYGYV